MQQVTASPCDGLSPIEYQRDARQQRTIPMLRKDAPEAFSRIVLVVV